MGLLAGDRIVRRGYTTDGEADRAIHVQEAEDVRVVTASTVSGNRAKAKGSESIDAVDNRIGGVRLEVSERQMDIAIVLTKGGTEADAN